MEMDIWNPESPFLETTSFPVKSLEDEAPILLSYVLETPWSSGETPFLRDEYETQGLRNTELEVISELLAELRDETFEDSVYRLVGEANNFLGDRYSGEYGEAEAQSVEAERQLVNFFEPLVQSAEEMYERMGNGLERQDLTAIGEADLEALLDQYQPATGTLNPEFENFIGKLFKKAKSVVKGAINLAKKTALPLTQLAFRPLLNKLKALVKPLLERVLKFALNKLPSGIRPIAEKLARQLFGQVAGEIESESDMASNTLNAEIIQQEYDLQLADLLISPELELEQSITEYAQTESLPIDAGLALQNAKEQFIQELSRLEKGQDPTPIIQNFIPAVIMAAKPLLRGAIQLIGRQRVVSLIGTLIGKLGERILGKEEAKKLGDSIGDLTLGFFGFEVKSSDPYQMAAEIVAETLEQTVLQLAQLPENILENETMLEAYTREAFEKAASAYFPDSAIRSELRETAAAPGIWVSMPRQRKRRYYRKYSRVFDVDITPQIATNIRIFGGASLLDFLQDVLLITPGKSVKAKMHLYELTLGSRLMDIAAREKDVPGLGSWRWDAWSQIHPLTPEAAAILLKEPGLGKAVDPSYLAGPYLTAIGQRFYYLQIPGLFRPPTATVSGTNRVSLTVNLGKASITVRFQFSEKTAQEIAKALRRQDIAGAWRVAKTLDNMLREVIKSRSVGFKLIGFELEEYLGVSTEGLLPAIGARALASVGVALLQKLLDKFVDFVWELTANYFKATANDFIRATENPSDGVTMYISCLNVPGLAQIRNLREGGVLSAILPSLDKSVIRTSISVFPGCNR